MERIEIALSLAPEWCRTQIAMGRVLHCASRPLLGEKPPGAYAGYVGALEVPYAPGLFVCALDPRDAYFARFSKENERLDAREVVFVPDADLEARFTSECEENGVTLREVLEVYPTWREAARANGHRV
jgi:hypothetical protein